MVQAGKFAPIGLRGNYTSRQGFGVADYALQANDQTLLVVLIEDIEAIDNLPEILTVDHVDVFFVAPGDLAQTMGLLGQTSHPEVLDTVDRALRQITEAGRVAGTLVNDSNVEGYIEKGVRFLLTGWAAWVGSGSKAFLDKVSSASTQPPDRLN